MRIVLFRLGYNGKTESKDFDSYESAKNFVEQEVGAVLVSTGEIELWSGDDADYFIDEVPEINWGVCGY